ncbi:MAG: hypothetical protein ACRDK7_09530 [Solirubrobacteraceae bacterium]
MPTTHEIAPFDVVELTVPIECAPAGSRGAVLEMLDEDTAMVEVMTMPLEPILERIVAAPLSKLRRMGGRAPILPDTPGDVAA